MKVFVIVFSIVIAAIMPVTSACAYGNGGGSGDVGIDDSFGMGTVSWSTSSLALTIAGSSMWSGRPTNIKESPDQKEREVFEHEQELLDGFKSGKYTKENVKTTLEWAKKVGFQISDEAQKTLDALSPTEKPDLFSGWWKPENPSEATAREAIAVSIVALACGLATNKEGGLSPVQALSGLIMIYSAVKQYKYDFE